jgi:chromosome segregation protein
LKLTELELAGFKSFADPAKITIEPGMTGIVGPNGCGKSNLVEALSWAMGETSAKRMRADGMDSVIFGGTDHRPAKPFCKVGITVDNRTRQAPVEFNDADTLYVTRRLDRGEGSSYEVNGRPAKAREVQTLFKDAGIGAGSSALVSQGKVADLIRAKPIDRKQILEEAAGVTGLASRRHEADLRLRATETNLEQSLTLGKELEDMQASLKRQARQAKFKLEIDGMVRAAEATVYLVRYRTALQKEQQSLQAHEGNEEVVKELMIELSARQIALKETEDAVAPALKARSDAEMAHALAAARVETVRKEAETARKTLVAIEKNVARAQADILRDKTEITDSFEEQELLKDEVAIALDDKENDQAMIEEAAVSVLEAKELLDGVAVDLSEASSSFAALKVQWSAAQKAVDDLSRRLEQSRQRLSVGRERIRAMQAELDGLPKPSFELEGLEQDLEMAVTRLQEAADEREHCFLAASEASASHSSCVAEESVLLSEQKALMASRRANGGLRDVVSAAPGFEGALAAAIGNDLDAGLDVGDGKHWLLVKVRAEPPRGALPLAGQVKVPPVLDAALSGVGVVETAVEAAALSSSLVPGQVIVTKDGHLLRWDGLRSTADASAAEEIKRTARLDDLQKTLVLVADRVAAARSAMVASQVKAEDAGKVHAREKDLVESIKRDLDRVRKQSEEVEDRRAVLRSKIEAATESQAMMQSQVEDEAVELERSESEATSLPDLGEAERSLSVLKAASEKASRTHEEKRLVLEKARRDADLRAQRIVTIQQKMSDFERRMVTIRQHIAELEERLKEYRAEEEELRDSTAMHPDAEADALDELEAMGERLVEASKEAKLSDGRLEEAKTALRQVEEKVVVRREDRARLLAEIKAAKEATGELAREVEERLSVSPAALAGIAGIGEADELPDLAICDNRLQGLLRRRDTVGTVNLLAEEQLREVDEKLGRSHAQREELREAVSRLRKQIEAFDRERRERLIEAFALIDGHFKDLFTRLFRGGRAFLKLSDSDDPLDAGLEVYACPPGKNLQTMSLLSGGEQALTAIALVFAAFLIRPAPICVLDEVDAAMDDANIYRLCSLVKEMAGEQTRFLVITHRPLTMATCDRLYGVTMPERGVSRLTSLDMSQAQAFVEQNFSKGEQAAIKG